MEAKTTGVVLSHYRLLEQIGAGGMGVVYRAHDEHLDCDVAVKLLAPGLCAEEHARKRFRREALTLSKLNHPNIAIVHDFDTQGDTDFLVQEFIEGCSVDAMLATGPLREKEVMDLGAQLAEGLAAAHAQGVIHRDLKPANLRVTPEGRLKILDFGLARMAPLPTAQTVSETDTASFAGTLPYISPEQLLGEEVDVAADIWSMGCVLYEMATGSRPFWGNGAALIDKILHQAPAPPAQSRRQLPPSIEAIILKCLEKDPSLRYSSAREVAIDLRRLRSGASVVSAATPRRRAFRRGSYVAAAGIVLAISGLIGYRFLRTAGKIAPAVVTPTSVAVLPFVDLSADKSQGYFSDGLAEDILDSLTKIKGLHVAARTSSFTFKGDNPDLRMVGERLNVGTVLEGSVRREGRRVRVTAELINVADGFQLWSETYDRQLDDMFAVQQDIARAVARALKVELLGTGAGGPQNGNAYNLYLQGRYFSERRTKNDLENGIRYFEQSIQLDPDYAQAWVGLAQAHVWDADGGYVPTSEGYGQARVAVQRALALDDKLADAHNVMGWIQRTYDWDWAASDASYKRALSLQPGNADAAVGAGNLAATLGRFDEALLLHRQAVQLSPLYVFAQLSLGQAALYSGHTDEAIGAFRKAVELDPNRPCAHTYLGRALVLSGKPEEGLAEIERETDPSWQLYGLALAYHHLGRKKESDAALAELTARFSGRFDYQIAEAHAMRGESDLAFHYLERTYAEHDGGLAEMKGDPLLKNVWGDSRYAGLLKRMRLTFS